MQSPQWQPEWCKLELEHPAVTVAHWQSVLLHLPLAGIAGGVATYYMTRTPILRYALKVVVTSTTIVVHRVPVVDASAAVATSA
jgi:hypothetical protein